MKIRKKEGVELLAFFVGGAKLQATTTYQKGAELIAHIKEAEKSGDKSVVIDTVNESEEIADDALVIYFEKMIFYTVIEKNKSMIIAPPGGKIARVP